MTTLALVVSLVLAVYGSASAQPCDYYASPNGGGNGLFADSPFQIADFWAVARPGATLCLLDGIYRGAQSMIAPGVEARGLSGISGQPITIRALNDGAVAIDGQFVRRPVHLKGNSWWVLAGFNARSSNSTVVHLDDGSSNNVFRRICAWDGAIDSNSKVFGLANRSTDNTFEDICGFGTGRKIFYSHSGSNNNIVRRAWFRWEGSTFGSVGPAASAGYLTTGTLFENVLVTWSGESMPETYAVADMALSHIGKTNFQPYGSTKALGLDRLHQTTVPKHGNLAIRGSVAYVTATDRIPEDHSWMNVRFSGASSVTLTDVLSIISPAHPGFNDQKYRSISLQRGPQHGPTNDLQCVNPATPGFPCPLVNVTATRLTSLRGPKVGDEFHADWTVSGVSAGTMLGEIQTPWQNTSSTGARLCYRWGTTTPLWPWPMNERIKAATAAAGRYTGPCTIGCAGGRAARTQTDVMADIQTLLGPISDHCKGS